MLQFYLINQADPYDVEGGLGVTHPFWHFCKKISKSPTNPGIASALKHKIRYITCKNNPLINFIYLLKYILFMQPTILNVKIGW